METVCRDACSGHDVARVRGSRRARGIKEGEERERGRERGSDGGRGEGGREERKKGRRERGRMQEYMSHQPLQQSTYHSVKKYYVHVHACTLYLGNFFSSHNGVGTRLVLSQLHVPNHNCMLKA